MPKKKVTIICLLLCLFFLTACNDENGSKVEETKLELEEGQIKIYYANLEQTQLVPVPYDVNKNAGIEKQAEDILNHICLGNTEEGYLASIPSSVKITGIEWSEPNISVICEVDYNILQGYEEILARAAMVKSLCQLESVESVDFKVNGNMLTDSNNNLVGRLNDTSFVDEGEESSTVGELMLYFSNDSGGKLVRQYVIVDLSQEVSIEEIVLECLIAGPGGTGAYSCIPAKTKVNKAATKDGVCYVDLSKEFLESLEGVKNEVKIYAVVNSLIELPTVSKVSLTIEGKKIAEYYENMASDDFLERKLDLIEES